MLDLRLQLQGIAWTLRVLGGRKKLLHTRNTRRRIRLGRTCRVEGIQRELCRGFTNGLSRKSTHHFTRMNLSLNVAEANVTQKLGEESLGQAMNENGLLGSQMESQKSVEETIARELVLELGEFGHHLRRREIRLCRLRIAVLLKETRNVNGSHNHIISLLAAEHTPHDHLAIL